MPRGVESTDGYSTDSAETEEDYEKKDEAKVADPLPQWANSGS